MNKCFESNQNLGPARGSNIDGLYIDPKKRTRKRPMGEMWWLSKSGVWAVIQTAAGNGTHAVWWALVNKESSLLPSQNQNYQTHWTWDDCHPQSTYKWEDKLLGWKFIIVTEIIRASNIFETLNHPCLLSDKMVGGYSPLQTYFTIQIWMVIPTC